MKKDTTGYGNEYEVFIISVSWYIEHDLQWCGKEKDSFEMGCYIKMHTRHSCENM